MISTRIISYMLLPIVLCSLIKEVMLTMPSSYFRGEDRLAYCQNEDFVAKCRRNEFIVMTTATYGRMEVGRCIKSAQFGGIGCKEDMLQMTDRNCSGKQSCTIRVTNEAMDNVLKLNPDCSTDLGRYLEADYRCEKALNMSDSCKKPTTATVQNGHVISEVTRQTGCGNKTAPWLLSVQPGQTLNLSLIDFNWRKRESRGIKDNCPVRYGYIIDLENDDKMTEICGGGRRYQHLYQSVSNVLQVVLEQSSAEKASFAVKYEAIGCPNLIQPKDAILRRDGDKTVVECHSRKQQWHLKCVGTKWVGVIGNCTQQAAAIARQSQMQGGGFGIPHGVAIFIVIAISLIISGIIIFIGTLCIQSYTHPKNGYMGQRGAEGTYKDQQQYQQHIHEPKQQQQHKDNTTRCANPNLHRNEYMHIWDHPLPEPCIEEYQLPLQNNNVTTENEQDVLSKMKIIHDEMSRGLEKCVTSRVVVPYDEQLVGIENPRVGIENPRAGSENPRVGIENPRVGIENPRVGIENPRICMPVNPHSNSRHLTLDIDSSHPRGSM